MEPDDKPLPSKCCGRCAHWKSNTCAWVSLEMPPLPHWMHIDFEASEWMAIKASDWHECEAYERAER